MFTQAQKNDLDEEEASWLRGGFDTAVEEIEKLKQEAQDLQDEQTKLEQQSVAQKEDYEKKLEKVF